MPWSLKTIDLPQLERWIGQAGLLPAVPAFLVFGLGLLRQRLGRE